MRKLALIALIVVVAAIVGLAAFDVFGGGDDEGATSESRDDDARSTDIVGPEVPGEGVLTGHLVFTTGEDCRPSILDLTSLEVGSPGPATGCKLWVSDDGFEAVSGAAGIRRGEYELALLSLGDEPDSTPLGTARGEVTWSPSGDSVAWCTENGTVVRSVSDESTRTVTGCSPRFSPDGSLLTLDDDFFRNRVLRDGEEYLSSGDLASALPSGITTVVSIIGYDRGASGHLALALVGFGEVDAVQQIQVWDGRELAGSMEIARTDLLTLNSSLGDFGLNGRLVRISPDGTEVAMSTGFRGAAVTLYDYENERRLALPEQRDFTWSPDGVWFVLSTGDEVAVYGAERSSRAYAFPIAVEDVAWR